ncbi:MAG: bifunctional UDP-N-acetylglucosamine diphosphorylase/glucosamine-1-phosphate N-acetyltransferase GlmU [Gammaproteobacteria bacterium]|nr:bifunctional UDP-N-acetylglucosamine diphosphorylase/glucosamine-1-phosphate N-acetyltransferase GlmU [Gammaproteobacteria bacterium]
MAIQVVILAAGRGQRMCSKLPKVLHLLAGKPLLQYVLEVAEKLSPAKKPIVVLGHQAPLIRKTFSHLPIHFVEQSEQLGTGHAVLQAMPHIEPTDQVLILCGDVPLISLQSLQRLTQTADDALHMLTAHLENPHGYGRIKRNDDHHIVRIIEEKDASVEEKKITEVNPGIYCLSARLLNRWLPNIKTMNAQNEFYLTDIINFAHQDNVTIQSHDVHCAKEILGVNDRAQLAQLERFLQLRLVKKLMAQGVSFADPARVDIRGEVIASIDVTVDVNVIFEGRVVLGQGCHIGPHSLLRNTILGEGVEIKANSVLDGAEVADHCTIGPFARLRPGTVLASHVHIGNFVEVKNSQVGMQSKINHLSYVGDAEIGQRVNVGAGTITCNYDGMNKHKTIIGDDTFIGSDTQLVAPVTIGTGATIGAGSTITKDVAADQLTITHRIEQRTIKNWRRPDKKERGAVTKA